MEELKTIEEIKKELVAPTEEKKSIGALSVNDIEMVLDKNKSYEEQAADVAGAMATARAVSDEKVAHELSEKKAEELIASASSKAKKAVADDINAETEKQEAERKLYEAVLETFGIKKHLPQWLMKTLVFIFSPIYVALYIAIGIPSGALKILIDCSDNIICRYEGAEDKNKPKIKVTVIIFLVLLILTAAALVTLRCLNKI